MILGAAILGVGNGSLGFLDKIENGNLFFGLSILIRVVTAIGNKKQFFNCNLIAPYYFNEAI